jgi:hypothetical protein
VVAVVAAAEVAAAAVLEADLRRACEAAIDAAGETSLAIKKVVIRIVFFCKALGKVRQTGNNKAERFDQTAVCMYCSLLLFSFSCVWTGEGQVEEANRLLYCVQGARGGKAERRALTGIEVWSGRPAA